MLQSCGKYSVFLCPIVQILPSQSSNTRFFPSIWTISHGLMKSETTPTASPATVLASCENFLNTPFPAHLKKKEAAAPEPAKRRPLGRMVKTGCNSCVDAISSTRANTVSAAKTAPESAAQTENSRCIFSPPTASSYTEKTLTLQQQHACLTQRAGRSRTLSTANQRNVQEEAAR